MNTVFKKPTPEAVEVDGITVYVRKLNAGGLARLLHQVDSAKAGGEPWKTDFEFVAVSVIDAEGNRIFADADAVADESPAVVARLLQACLKANGIGTIDEKKA